MLVVAWDSGHGSLGEHIDLISVMRGPVLLHDVSLSGHWVTGVKLKF